jgi:hypothetical protein
VTQTRERSAAARLRNRVTVGNLILTPNGVCPISSSPTSSAQTFALLAVPPHLPTVGHVKAARSDCELGDRPSVIITDAGRLAAANAILAVGLGDW